MNTDQLWQEISNRIMKLGYQETEYHIRWNFITDIVTNEIRPCAIEEAKELLDDLIALGL